MTMVSNRFGKLGAFGLAFGLSALVAATGCSKKSDEAAPAGSSSAATATTTAAAAKKAKTTLKFADVKAAYKAEMEDFAKMKTPLDKRMEAFIAKVGKPESDNGRKKTWYALDGDKCMKCELDNKDGSLMEQATTAADCGM